MSLSELLKSWKPSDWKDIRQTWSELNPKPEPGTVPGERKFREKVLNAAEAGKVFEDWVLKALKMAGHSGHPAFEVKRPETPRHVLHQIDGLLYMGYQGFLIESKFLDDKVDVAPIAKLAAFVEQRPWGSLGLFFSATDFTTAAHDYVLLMRPIKVLLVGGSDLVWAVESKERFARLVRDKWLVALRDGRPYAPAREFDASGWFGEE